MMHLYSDLMGVYIQHTLVPDVCGVIWLSA
jgi:hypothetical protein